MVGQWSGRGRAPKDMPHWQIGLMYHFEVLLKKDAGLLQCETDFTGTYTRISKLYAGVSITV